MPNHEPRERLSRNRGQAIAWSCNDARQTRAELKSTECSMSKGETDAQIPN
jgi:hypothetical protein